MSNWHEATDGWRSKGRAVECPRCHETGSMIETTIHGKTRITFFCNVCSVDWYERTYDDRQKDAPLVTCEGCGQNWFMVVPRQPCVDCRRKP